MDHTQPEPWCQERFMVISQTIRTMLVDRLGFEDGRVVVVPVSGLKGVNLVPSSKDIATESTATATVEATAAVNGGIPSWYQGLTLLECIHNTIPHTSESDTNSGSFRAVITSIDPSSVDSKTFNVNVIILRGKIKLHRHIGLVGTSVCQLKKIVDSRNNAVLEWACSGCHVTLTLIDRAGRTAAEMGVKSGNCLYKGSSLSLSPSPSLKAIPRLITHMQALVHTSPYTPTPILVGTMFELYTHGDVVECYISKIIQVESATSRNLSTAVALESSISSSSSSSSVIKSKLKCVPVNSLSKLEITCQRPICMECFSDFESFGRFVLRTLGKTVGTGVCIAIVK